MLLLSCRRLKHAARFLKELRKGDRPSNEGGGMWSFYRWLLRNCTSSWGVTECSAYLILSRG